MRVTNRATHLTTAVVAILISFCLPARAENPSIQHARLSVDNVTINLVSINLNDPTLLVTPGVAQDTPEKRKTFNQFLEDNHALAQITGTFFDLRSGIPVGDIVVRGKQIFSTARIGTALVVTPDNKAAMLDCAPGPAGWAGYESVLQGGLRLVREGQVDVNPEAQGFHDRYMRRNTSRVAVGLLPGNRMLMVNTGHVLLPELAEIMARLGCTDAMALDGGGSTGLAYNGKAIISTKRKLPNVLMVVRRSPQEIAQRQQAARATQRRVTGRKAGKPGNGFSFARLGAHLQNFLATLVSIFPWNKHAGRLSSPPSRLVVIHVPPLAIWGRHHHVRA